MASVDQHCDTLDKLKEDKPEQKEVKMSSSGVSVDLNAQTGATVKAPVLAGNNITSVTLNYNTAGNEPQNITETVEKHKEEQGAVFNSSILLNHTAQTGCGMFKQECDLVIAQHQSVQCELAFLK
ncbi:hypothetical protein DPX16_2674 [Anabarilius grahami]|uniref:Uncharacterized protein n=1 Tax=Anabarilius grahami TaxID=495550 RepID=A0A3N0YPF7_ANAGA|nr:hypothetical protein DPX16_2674 [Anabarilius grahami]